MLTTNVIQTELNYENAKELLIGTARTRHLHWINN